MNTNKIIPIFFATDENYVPFLAVSMQSMLSNASKEYVYKIYILNNGLKEENINKLNQYNSNNVSIEYVDVAKRMAKIGGKFHTRDYYTKSTYYRIFIPNMFPEYDKALYLDCDIVVLGDISKLYNTNIGDNLLGAIPDEAIATVPAFQSYANRALGIATDKYFNAGILVMNLAGLREMNFESVFVDVLSRYKFTVAQDQDYLNVICKDRVYYIENVWNKMPIGDMVVAEEDLMLIHYNLNDKPWKFDNVKYEKYFWQYSVDTDFYQEILDFKSNYTIEKQEKDLVNGQNLQVMALNEANSELNYYNLYVKNADKKVDLMDLCFDNTSVSADSDIENVVMINGEGCI